MLKLWYRVLHKCCTQVSHYIEREKFGLILPVFWKRFRNTMWFVSSVAQLTFTECNSCGPCILFHLTGNSSEDDCVWLNETLFTIYLETKLRITMTPFRRRLFRRRTKKTSKLRVTGLCEGNSPVTCGWPVNSSHKGPVTRKMFPFDDVIMDGLVAGKNWHYFAHDLCWTMCWPSSCQGRGRRGLSDRLSFVWFYMLLIVSNIYASPKIPK